MLEAESDLRVDAYGERKAEPLVSVILGGWGDCSQRSQI